MTANADTPKNILVVGGAGYIGSHMVRLLAKNDCNPIVLDNLVDGHRESVAGHTLIVGDINDREHVSEILREHEIEAVIHFAAFAQVGESVTNPAKYYQNNVVGTCSLLEAMRENDVSKIVFSSTCATYGEPNEVPIKESESQEPVNPYGFYKTGN